MAEIGTDRPTSRAARTRHAVLEAALALFAERGYAGTTIPDVMAKAQVGAGSLYRLFPSKEALANEVFREAKRRLSERLFAPIEPNASSREIFEALWWRLVRFAREDSLAFRFLELQDHIAYLDGQSRQLDVSTLAPLYLGFPRLQERNKIRDDLRPDAMLALIWGALVGLIKNERLGYVRLDDATLKATCDVLYVGLSRKA